jgi:hypothetical protein
MPAIYASLIKKGLKSLEQVPAVIRADVSALLEVE